MIELFSQGILSLNSVLFGNLGLTILVVGVVSRLIFYPFFAQSIRYTKLMRDLKPKLDEVKKKHGHDMRKHAQEQSRLFKEHGVSPSAGALSCLSIIVQLGVFILLFQSLSRIIASGIDTNFLLWDLAKPDAYRIGSIPFAIPGILVLATAVLSFAQTKMIQPESSNSPGNKGKNQKKEGKSDFAEALSGTQSQMAYIIPVIILISGTQFAAGLALYWLISTVFGIIQQLMIAGPGGLKSWLVKANLSK